MINPTGKKLEKLLFRMFDDAIKGVDTYNHNGSMWLIFTDEMKWVVEYTKEQTLWYNYYFFKNEMEMISLDCVENKDLIQKWFELRFLNMGEVKETDKSNSNYRLCVEDTIQNGVKNTLNASLASTYQVEDTIQNGVKETTPSGYLGSIEMKGKVVHQIESSKQNNEVEDTIQNGVKRTEWYDGSSLCQVEDTIQNGVKEIKYGAPDNRDYFISCAIENGVKDMKESHFYRKSRIKDATQNGVKHITDRKIIRVRTVEDTIQNGIKEK